MWFYIAIGVLMIFLGLSIHVFKWYFLISGYNTMPKEKQEKVNTEGLGRLIGIYFYSNGGISIAMGVLNALGVKSVLLPIIIFFSISTVYTLIKAQKYDGNMYDENGKLREGAWKQLVFTGGFGSVVIIFIIVMLFFSSQPAKVTFIDNGVQIHGMYGGVFEWDAIKDVKMIEELPAIGRRTNGSALGSNLKGYFMTEELGSVKLLVNTQKPPFIYLETDNGIVIFNTATENETQKIFDEMLNKVD